MRQTRQRIHRRFRAPCNLSLLNNFRRRERAPGSRDVTTKRYETAVPGFWHTIRCIPAAKRVARTSEEFKPDRSTMSSICTVLSELGNSYLFAEESTLPPAVHCAGPALVVGPSREGRLCRRRQISVPSSPWVTRLALPDQLARHAECFPPEFQFAPRQRARGRGKRSQQSEASNSLASRVRNAC
jgi:hypothetical protein